LGIRYGLSIRSPHPRSARLRDRGDPRYLLPSCALQRVRPQEFPMLRLALLAALAGAPFLGAAPAHAVDACDALTVKVIRSTGASLAGRAGPYAVFRAQDAERMSLDCRAPARITLASRDREPPPAYFVLVGRAAQALSGANASAAEVLALNLHQASLLTSAPRRGSTGRALMLCETGPRSDGLRDDLTVCRVAPRAGLSRIHSKG
jgi:hypothetical protein